MSKIIGSDWAMRIAIFICLVLLAIVLVVGIRTATDTRASRRLAEGQVTAQDRSDCVRDLTQQQNDVVRHRDNLGWQGLLLVASNDEAALRVIAPQLAQAVDAVNRLRPLPDLVRENCPAVPDTESSLNP